MKLLLVTHEPCLYLGMYHSARVLFKRQVDDFEVACAVPSIAAAVFDKVDEYLTFPFKHMGLVTLFNGIDVLQTRDYVKGSVETYLERVCKHHLDTWMKVGQDTASTPLPCKKEFIQGFLTSKGNNNPDAQAALAKEMGLGYRSGVGKNIFAMVTAGPGVAHAVTRLSQHNVCPHKMHYAGLRRLLQYLFVTRDDGIFYWRAKPREDLPAVEPPRINSNMHDLMMNGRPVHQPLDMYSYMDAEWATCLLTR